MTLDLPTLSVMQSFAMALAGALLFFYWAQNRRMTVLAVWGTAHLSASLGIIALTLGYTLRQPLWSAAAGVFLTSQAGLMWKGARNIDRRPASYLLAFAGPAALIAAGSVPILRGVIISISMGIGVVYSFLAAATLYFGKTDRLFARWPLVGLNAVHGVGLLIGVYSTFIGSTGQDAVPALWSLFGFIYFETTVYALGTAVFAIALFKERDEAATLALARTDALTGIANRAHFLDTGERALRRCRRDGMPASVVMFDLDRFKSINDQFGHAVGDTVLQKFCEMTCAVLRPRDLFGRIGGEEFAVIMPGCGIEAAYVRSDRIRSSFAESSRFVGGRPVKSTVSGGVAMRETSAEALDVLLKLADAALYEAKGDGRNRVKRASREAAADNVSNVFRVA